MKLKGGRFDTIEEIEAESQAVLNTPTEHNSMIHLKNGRSAGTTSRVMGASMPKVSS
jgi:hypothetical protein